MKAAVFHGPHQNLTVEDVDIDSPGPHEVIVKTVSSGVCHSDLHFVDGLYPFPAPAILGHEAAGVVEEVGSLVDYVKPGDHVISCLSVFCGHCEKCISGRPNLCASPEVRRGPSDPPKLTWNGEPVAQFANLSAYAEKMLVHENALVKMREDMPFNQAALIGCGVTTGVGAVLNTAAIEAGLWPIAVLILVSSLLACVYVWRVVEVAYFREPDPGAIAVSEAPVAMLAPTLILAAASIYFGIDTDVTVGVARMAAENLLGNGS